MSWNSFPEEHNPGILVNYEVNYKEIGSENWLTKQVWSTEEPYVITGLESFTSYTVSVTMVNLEGKGIAASVNVSTEEEGKFVYREGSKTWAIVMLSGYHLAENIAILTTENINTVMMFFVFFFF